MAITSHAPSSQLAVAFGCRVQLFQYDVETQKWKYNSVIDTSNKITSLDWSLDGRLLLAGEKLAIWQYKDSQWNELWTVTPASRIMLAQFSPNNTLFATVGQFDQLVTLWYRTDSIIESTLTYDFIYLNHPRDVTYFAWRHLPAESGSSDCTLYTMCRDGVGRFWSPTDINLPHRLYMCAVIDPSQSLVTADSSASICSSSHNSMMTTSTSDDYSTNSSNNDNNTHHMEEFSPIHYIDCDELRNAIKVYEIRQANAHHRHHQHHHYSLDQQLEKVKNLIRDTPDLLFRLQPDGSIIFWGVQYLNSWPRRIPKTFVILRIDQAVDPKDGAFFLNKVHIVHDLSHIQSLSTIKPVELSIVAKNSHGEIRCYGLNLVDFLDSTSFEPRLRLKYSWAGHQQPITNIIQTQGNRFCTISTDGQINLWNYGLYQTSGLLTTQLLLDRSVQVRHAVLSVPIDNDRLFAVYNGKQVLIYEFDSLDHHLHQHHQELPMYDSAAPLSSLFVHDIDDQDDSNHTSRLMTTSASFSSTDISSSKRYLLFGLSTATSKLFTWEINDIGLYGKICNIVYRGCQHMSWEVEPTVVTPTRHQRMNGTAAKLLRKLATGSTSEQYDNDSSDAKTTVMTLDFVVGVKSILYFYGIQDDQSDQHRDTKWDLLYQLDTGLENILQVCCASSNIAIVSSVGDIYRLSIWMEIRTNVAPCFIKSFEFNERIQDIAWCISSDAQFFLAVAFQHRVSIYGQKRATQLKDDLDVWTLYTEFDVDTEQRISGVIWVAHGGLIVTAGNQVRSYLKWLTVQEEDTSLKNTASLYDLSYENNGPLSLYHPRHLLHYLLWGKVDLINTVLQSLLRFLRQVIETDFDHPVELAPPFSLEKILALQNSDTLKIKPSQQQQQQQQQQQYNALFGGSDNENQSYAFDDDSDEDLSRPLSIMEAGQLKDMLKTRQLPGLSDNERMHLLAMIDSFVEISNQGEALDENGARFTALLENHFHLNKMLPPEEQKMDLESRDIAYALHSQSQDILLERCIRLCGGKLLWQDARSLGLFLWLQKIDVVKELLASIARNTYLAKEDLKDPVDCTLFYLALRKKSLLQSLWRTATYHKEQRVMITFLANDFTQPRWQKAAAKNAFVLLGRQRFEYAAAFFLLADKLKDAINVILKNLKDYQLAIVICRVYDGDDSPLLKDILNNYVIPLAIETNDRWLLTTAYWLLGNKHDAVRSIIVPLSQIKLAGSTELIKSESQTSIFKLAISDQQDKEVKEENDSAATVNDPTLFILYQHVKQHVLQLHKGLGIPYELEYLFSLQVIRAYERIGCPLLSLYVMTRYPMKSPSPNKLQATIINNDNGDTSLTITSDEKTSSRAADLFADDGNDIFASTGKQSKAVDLFAEDGDIFATGKQSKTTDLFADDDIFADLKTRTLLENDDDIQDNLKYLSSSQDISESETIEDGYGELGSYKGLLVIRILQTIFHSAAAMCHSIPDKVLISKYRQQYLDNRQVLFDLGEKIGIDKSLLSKLLMEKSIETDVFPLYLQILDKCVPDNFNMPYFLTSFQLGCFQIFQVITIRPSLDLSALVFIENWIDDVIDTFSIWNRLMKDYLPAMYKSNRTFKICLEAYVCLILVTTKQRHFEKTWTLLYHFTDFMDHIYTEDPTMVITTLFEDILKHEAKLVEMDPEDFESFSDESLFGFDLNEEKYKPWQDFQDHSIGAIVLELASLNAVLSNLEQGMHHAKNNKINNSDDLVDFVWTTLLDPIAYRAHCLQSKMENELDHDLTRSNILKHFKTLRQKKYWHSLKTLFPDTHLLPFAQLSPPEINVLSGEPHHPHSNTVYNAGTTIHAFCINLKTGTNGKLGDIVAVCTKSEIQEIDMNNAQRFSAPLHRAGSTSSKDWNMHEFVESYPDTEEEMDSVTSDMEPERDPHHSHHHPHTHHHNNNNNNNDNNTAVKSPVGGKRHGLHHHSSCASTKSSTASTPISPMAGRLLQPEDRIQNSSFDNLHETLKKSLGVGKEGSDVSRSPTGNNFSFYFILLDITGCEVTNDGPSAILWQFGQEREITNYYGCRGKVTRIHFDAFGQKFGAGDTTGSLCLWKFDSHAQPNKPYYTTMCHSKATRDFTFLNSSSLLATAGTSVTMSRKRDHLCIWDPLLPPSSSMVCSLPGHDNGAYAIAYEGQGHLIFSGGKRGEIVVSDIRQRSTMHTFTAHSSRIRSIAIDNQNHTLITGSIDGELKIWDASTYKLQQTFDIQPRNRFLAPSFNRIPVSD
ncbi:RAVE protein 1 C terminal-domain-containing protein [Halteromyces radiatus]|uniref:RAVE protein 1 C terminal-domain-containing protein n=1 Tax=Halteromyces radiatus TaxID=101107 RepID=UPI00221E5335|nr:RAVE protein 1 C terminal-domain-containing protein [Halteromyces radiatus]KAI8085118.1 RAVE protein 1 C terminal-domain-containing protein [Halteromyces radiatus]